LQDFPTSLYLMLPLKPFTLIITRVVQNTNFAKNSAKNDETTVELLINAPSIYLHTCLKMLGIYYRLRIIQHRHSLEHWPHAPSIYYMYGIIVISLILDFMLFLSIHIYLVSNKIRPKECLRRHQMLSNCQYSNNSALRQETGVYSRPGVY